MPSTIVRSVLPCHRPVASRVLSSNARAGHRSVALSVSLLHQKGGTRKLNSKIGARIFAAVASVVEHL